MTRKLLVLITVMSLLVITSGCAKGNYSRLSASEQQEIQLEIDDKLAEIKSEVSNLNFKKGITGGN